ncbi:hypothetical protein SAMN05216188_114103 [Lentzea xinjiangensis]|uniref:SH3 domain-containing protein n=1 Tax=Lentzea xinjiangensis TaxID=402600 RepID=A0A1H9RG99_9PSEU|nr:hypothetical protein [Lentzea xinjiangensis]SER71013.1 hypothetical protein SAMN05216188_114103 [Lentzea xinjiangensis]
MRTVLGSLLAILAFIGGAGVAQADPPAPPYPTVTTWHDAEVRTCEALSCPVYQVIPAGTSTIGICWTRGETVTALGYSNNVWIMVSMNSGGRYLVSAIYFEGNERANLPYENDCGPY